MDMTVSRAAAAGAGPGLGTVQPTKSPEAESETPPRIQPTKPISFSNGVLKRHAPPQVVYKECLKNHAATLGSHALDGCGEFMPSPAANSAEPTSLKCAACGCHRNFHRRDPEDSLVNSHINATHVIEYQPHHRHHPLPPPPSSAANRAESPPPISSTFAPHMLLALSTGVATANDGLTPLATNNGVPHHHHNHHNNIQQQQTSRKRFRTKFSQDQKDKMHEFAEKVGWKMQKTNEEMVNNFCNEIGVERGVFKVWMHNNKNTFGKRSTSTPTATATAASGSGNNNNNNGGVHDDDDDDDDDDEDNNADLNGNGNNSNSSISINDQSHHHIHHHHHHQQQQHFLNGKSNNNNNNASSSSS